MKTRKLLAILLTLAMMLSLMCTGAFAVLDNDHDRISAASGEYVILNWDSSNYHVGTLAPLVSGYYPNQILFYVDTGTISGITYTVHPGISGAYILTIPNTSGSFTVTLDQPNDGNGVYTISYSAAQGTKPTPSATPVGFLPAPGQFTNEGMGTGGWGDIYDQNGNLKMNVNPGVCLGFFGGYVVYEFETPVYNTASNPYGADFIVYGNAFWNNSEPGGIQVSQDGSTWYDVAGSKYYTSDTQNDYKLVYGNPNQENDPASAKAAVPYDIYINGVKQATGGTVAVNSFHNHLWFPLYTNYFATRTINSVSCPGLANTTSYNFADYIESSAIINNTSVYRTLALSGVLLKNVVTNDTTKYLFGYADVHPNNTLGGTVAYNPYAISGISNNNAFNTFLATASYSGGQASGGDPIDISWAVYPAGATDVNNNDISGQPVNLSSISFVRIYTAAAKDNPPFGEVSTEVLGIAACSGMGSSYPTDDPTSVSIGENTGVIPGKTISMIPTYTYEPDSEVVVSASGATGSYVIVNGKLSISTCTETITVQEGDQIVRIIIQDGTTNSPYIGYVRLVGEW